MMISELDISYFENLLALTVASSNDPGTVLNLKIQRFVSLTCQGYIQSVTNCTSSKVILFVTSGPFAGRHDLVKCTSSLEF